MDVIYLILLIAAAVCFFLAAAGLGGQPDRPRRVNLVALGLLLITAVWIIQLVDGPAFEAGWRKTTDREINFEVPSGG